MDLLTGTSALVQALGAQIKGRGIGKGSQRGERSAMGTAALDAEEEDDVDMDPEDITDDT